MPTFAEILAGLDAIDSIARAEGLTAPAGRLHYYREITQGILEASRRNEADTFGQQHGHVRVMAALVEASELAAVGSFLEALPSAVRRDRLRALLHGPPDLRAEQTTSSRGRNITFELHLAARLASKAIPVALTPTTDVVVHHPLGSVFVECKRPFGPHKFEKLGRKAFHQLERDIGASNDIAWGLVAMSVSRLVNPRASAFAFRSIPALSKLGSWLQPYVDDHLRFWASLRQHPRILGGLLHFVVPVFVPDAPEPIRFEERGLAVPLFSSPSHEHLLLAALLAGFSSKGEVVVTGVPRT